MSSRIAGLDAAGFMPLPGESEADFIKRSEGILACHRDFEEMLEVQGKLTVFDFVEVKKEEKIPPEIMEQAGEVTWNLYRFKVSHVPGFFLSRAVGLLWGGCLIGDPDEHFSLFLIRNSFRKKERWLFYRRTELFAHELCHSMRMELHESTLEEYFAYQTSPSRLRRYLGNCFIRIGMRSSLSFLHCFCSPHPSCVTLFIRHCGSCLSGYLLLFIHCFYCSAMPVQGVW